MCRSSILLKVAVFNQSIISLLWEEKLLEHFQIVFSCDSCGPSGIITKKIGPMMPLAEIAHRTTSFGESRSFSSITLGFHKFTMNCINCSSCRSRINSKCPVRDAEFALQIHMLLAKQQFCTSFLGVNQTISEFYYLSTLCFLKK